MFFKAVNKFTGAVDGWGKSKSLEEFCERYDMAQVDVEEISEKEFNELYKKVNSEAEECRAEIGKILDEENDEEKNLRLSLGLFSDEEEELFDDLEREAQRQIKKGKSNKNEKLINIGVTAEELVFLRLLIIDDERKTKKTLSELNDREKNFSSEIEEFGRASQDFCEWADELRYVAKRLAETRNLAAKIDNIAKGIFNEK